MERCRADILLYKMAAATLYSLSITQKIMLLFTVGIDGELLLPAVVQQEVYDNQQTTESDGYTADNSETKPETCIVDDLPSQCNIKTGSESALLKLRSCYVSLHRCVVDGQRFVVWENVSLLLHLLCR